MPDQEFIQQSTDATMTASFTVNPDEADELYRTFFGDQLTRVFTFTHEIPVSIWRRPLSWLLYGLLGRFGVRKPMWKIDVVTPPMYIAETIETPTGITVIASTEKPTPPPKGVDHA